MAVMPPAPYSQVLQNWSNLGLGGSKELGKIFVEIASGGPKMLATQDSSKHVWPTQTTI